MTKHADDRPVAVSPSLLVKLRQFMDELTPEEQDQVRTLQGQAGELQPSLRARFKQCAAELTADEAAEVCRLLERAGAGADTAGYAVGLYVGDDANKGRPHPGPPGGATGRDPASIVTGTGQNLLFILTQAAESFRPYLPF